jgi:2-polyprenyl-3-methyl-5-hydroxy-6-metoxy-1,4-benzoquinol methylase
MVPGDGAVIGSIGCGTGATEAVLVAQGRQVHGVDISPEAIEVARGRLTSARVIAADDRCPFAPESLDGLVLADVLEHIPMAWEALASFSKAVRPGGWVVISVPNMRGLDVLLRFFLLGDWLEHPSGIFDATHVQVMSRRRLARWCESAGLRVERWYSQYDARSAKRYYVSRLIDVMTCGLMHSWCMFQLQARCRRNR